MGRVQGRPPHPGLGREAPRMSALVLRCARCQQSLTPGGRRGSERGAGERREPRVRAPRPGLLAEVRTPPPVAGACVKARCGVSPDQVIFRRVAHPGGQAAGQSCTSCQSGTWTASLIISRVSSLGEYTPYSTLLTLLRVMSVSSARRSCVRSAATRASRMRRPMRRRRATTSSGIGSRDGAT